MGGGGESLFEWSRSHDKDGHHGVSWLKLKQLVATHEKKKCVIFLISGREKLY